ncbi:MAG TPA: serine O-acetyltransferase EpsC [Fimbriimonas sp.]|nr:serine O-acetyltransferase EpsC [Fimbriimonas sp.]
MEDIVRELIRRRSEHCFPLRVHSSARKFAHSVLAVLFPHFSETMRCDEAEVAAEVSSIQSQLQGIMDALADHFPIPPADSALEFINTLPGVYSSLMLDAKAIHYGDPAAVSTDEVILTYPGFFAIAVHRIAHELSLLGYPLLPRLLSEHAHERTGIDIHPKASIGSSFFIDHGTGVVVGETSIIGNGVKLYQGVTLGALSVEKRLANVKRHPTLGDNIVVYANATILGGETIIGHDTVVGANAWITESVPPFSIVGRNTEARPRRNTADEELEFFI